MGTIWITATVLIAMASTLLMPQQVETSAVVSWQQLIREADGYMEAGQYGSAEELLVRALGLAEGIGLEDPRVATTLNNLGLVLEKVGRYTEAERNYRKSLSIWEKATGAEHFSMTWALNNLARLQGLRGRYSEARRLYLRSLSIRERERGADPPQCGHRCP